MVVQYMYFFINWEKCKRRLKTSEMKASLEEAIHRKGIHTSMECRIEINEQKQMEVHKRETSILNFYLDYNDRLYTNLLILVIVDMENQINGEKCNRIKMLTLICN